MLGGALTGSVALRSVELFENENYLSEIAFIEAVSRRKTGHFKNSRIREIRIMGGCVCVEVYDSADLADLVQIFDTMKAWFR